MFRTICSLSLIAVVLMPLLAFGQTVTKQADPVPARHQGEGRAYDKNAAFSIVVPQGWKSIKKAGDSAFLTYVDPQAETAANVNARTVKYDGTPVDKWAAAIKDAMPKQFKDWKCVDDGAATIDGKKGYRILSSYSVTNNNQKVELMSLQYVIPAAKERAHIVTFTAKAQAFPPLKKTMEKAAEAIRVD